MSVLSESLGNFIRQKGLGIADLAKRCRIDRSTMYQYIHGKRPLQNRELLESILGELRLTPEERARVIQAFEITQIGEERYYRRKKVKEIFESLLTLEEASGFKVSHGQQEASEINQDILGSRLISGELEVQRAAKSIIRDACRKGKAISFFFQPDSFFYRMLSVLWEYPEASQVTHIICLNSAPDLVECDNLEIMKRVIRCGIAIRDYRPFYYYGIPSEHYGMMNMMPYFIMAEGRTMQLSTDGKALIIHTDEEVNRYFKEAFDKMLRLCHPLMRSTVGLEDRVAFGINSLGREKRYSDMIEMSSGLCSLQFWNRELIRKYLPTSLPGYENLLEGIACYMEGLYQAKKNGQVTILMNPVFVLEFIRTGVIKEYPSMYFRAPLEPEDRRYVLEQICQAIEEGWYHILFLEGNAFPLDYRWEATVWPHECLYMQYCINDQFRIFEFEIPEVVDAVCDYLQSLMENEFVMSEEASRDQIRRWMEKYL